MRLRVAHTYIQYSDLFGLSLPVLWLRTLTTEQDEQEEEEEKEKTEPRKARNTRKISRQASSGVFIRDEDREDR
jgi:hypothetical protein